MNHLQRQQRGGLQRRRCFAGRVEFRKTTSGLRPRCRPRFASSICCDDFETKFSPENIYSFLVRPILGNGSKQTLKTLYRFSIFLFENVPHINQMETKE